jgi:poly(hydroxyalkanoate) depolymerase family esterase
MLEAAHLVRTGQLTEATAVLQRLLGRHAPSASGGAEGMHDAFARIGDLLNGARIQEWQPSAASPPQPDEGSATSARFLNRSFSNHSGSRPYKLYVPGGYCGQPVPLVVMLHGCTQSPDDFAAGTRMNLAAEGQTCLVAYPGQTSAANGQKCWNWFKSTEQRRDGGEPALIASMTREIMQEYAVDPRRIFVAGLSAGGAAAAVLGQTYPDLFAAIGVHSGLACGAARDMQSGFMAMQQGSPGTMTEAHSGTRRRPVPVIVFHGDRDSTVNPRNGDAVVAQAAAGLALTTHTRRGRVPGGHAYSLHVQTTMTGQTMSEQWIVHGAGHAWSGGSPAGSFTDPKGPDATREILRFFLEHPLVD